MVAAAKLSREALAARRERMRRKAEARKAVDRQHSELRRAAERQARRNLYGPLAAGGIDGDSLATIAAIEERW